MGKLRWVALAVFFVVVLSPRAAVFAQTATPTPTATATQTPDYRTFVAIGSVQLVAGTPDTAGGWLICDGSAVSRTTYARLFAIIGTTFGAGDGSTTFNLPDLRGRVPVGSGAGTGLTARTLGQTFGEETHTLTVTEMPSHNHTITDPGHTHGEQNGSSPAYLAIGGTGRVGFGAVTTSSTTRVNTDSATTGITINNTGGGAAFNQMQPSLVLNYVIWSGDRAMPTPLSIAAEQTVVITVVVVFPTHTATPTPTPTFTPSPTLTVTPGPSPTWTPSPSPTVSTNVSYSVGSQAVMVDYTVTPGDAANTALLVIIVFVMIVGLFFYLRNRGVKS